jgi:hypothetical protein
MRNEAQNLGEQIVSTALQDLTSRDEYAFVAKINSVVRRDKLIARTTDGQDAEIEVDDYPRFIAAGECVAIKYLGIDKSDGVSTTVVPRRPGETIEQYLSRTRAQKQGSLHER